MLGIRTREVDSKAVTGAHLSARTSRAPSFSRKSNRATPSAVLRSLQPSPPLVFSASGDITSHRATKRDERESGRGRGVERDGCGASGAAAAAGGGAERAVERAAVGAERGGAGAEAAGSRPHRLRSPPHRLRQGVHHIRTPFLLPNPQLLSALSRRNQISLCSGGIIIASNNITKRRERSLDLGVNGVNDGLGVKIVVLSNLNPGLLTQSYFILVHVVAPSSSYSTEKTEIFSGYNFSRTFNFREFLEN